MSDKVFCGVLGFFLGGLIGGYLVGRMCGKRAKERIDELRGENEKLQKEIAAYEDPFGDPFDDETDIPEKDETVDIGMLSRKYGSDRFDKEMERYAGPTENAKDPNDIHIIDAESFRRDIETRDNETLTYYQEDGVLVNGNNEVIRNEESVIGVEAMEKIFDCGEDTEYVYVSDESDDKMYEIVIDHNQSFYRDIMGG